jgi:actin-like ATPase involved in cell morphogenesis
MKEMTVDMIIECVESAIDKNPPSLTKDLYTFAAEFTGGMVPDDFQLIDTPSGHAFSIAVGLMSSVISYYMAHGEHGKLYNVVVALVEEGTCTVENETMQ